MASADLLLPLPTPHTSTSVCHPTLQSLLLLHPGTWFPFPPFLALQVHYIAAAPCLLAGSLPNILL